MNPNAARMTETYSTKQSLISICVGCLILSSAIAGCAKANTQQAITPTTAATASSPTPTAATIPGIQQWTTIVKGKSAHGLTFTPDGKLLYQNKVLLTKIPVSYVNDGNLTYAQRLIVSDPSPSSRFNIVKACEGNTDEGGLCWSVFLVDRQSETAKRIDIAKYGGQNWVQWSTHERYAVFAESMESVTWFVGLDLQTGNSQLFDHTAATADLSSFTWVDDHTFQANIFCGDRADCTEAPFRGNISTLFTQ